MREYEVFETDGRPIKAWTRGVPIEDAARAQLNNVAGLPFIHKHVAVMPDVHWGMGATVGSVIPTKGAIIPAAVGVDIGCGMAAQRTTLTAADLPDNLHALRGEIEARVPHGRTDNGGPADRGAWGEVPANHAARAAPHMETLASLAAKHPKIAQAAQRAPAHAGTLGTGNHFIEVCLDEDDRVWLMLHSGSRGIGNRIGSYFIELAKTEMRRWFINPAGPGPRLPGPGLRPLRRLFRGGRLGAGLGADQPRPDDGRRSGGAGRGRAQAVRLRRRGRQLATTTTAAWEHHFGDNVMVTRKGAVKVTPTTLGIIPGSMGAKSFIVRGKAGEAAAQALNSCSHGAGRAMSRRKQRWLTLHHARAVAGVGRRFGTRCHRRDAGRLQEHRSGHGGAATTRHRPTLAGRLAPGAGEGGARFVESWALLCGLHGLQAQPSLLRAAGLSRHAGALDLRGGAGCGIAFRRWARWLVGRDDVDIARLRALRKPTSSKLLARRWQLPRDHRSVAETAAGELAASVDEKHRMRSTCVEARARKSAYIPHRFLAMDRQDVVGGMARWRAALVTGKVPTDIFKSRSKNNVGRRAGGLQFLRRAGEYVAEYGRISEARCRNSQSAHANPYENGRGAMRVLRAGFTSVIGIGALRHA